MAEQTREQWLQEIKEQHVQFVLADLSGDGLQRLIAEEIAELYAWFNHTSLNEVVDVSQVKAFVRHSIKHTPYTEHFHALLVNAVLAGVSADINQQASLSSLIPKNEFDDFIVHLAQYEEIRVDFIRALLRSPVYSELISDVLYHGIKDYVMNENLVTKKVPGVGSLMKMGAKSINKAMPNLESMAEIAVKKYIEANINRTLELSEKFLNNALNAHNIKKAGDHFWEKLEAKRFSQVADHVSEQDIEKAAALAKKLWLQIRETEYIYNILDVVIEDFFSQHGNEPMGELAEQCGFTRDYVLVEMQQYLPDALANGAVREFIESRVRANLSRFYDSL
ncbi:MAG: hypothetical protein CSA49_00910 [Gammaproteobacteria bacterium]|nr:MAG: hypothetical protein CSA49_00910 [Gammaproteobacteria bacterium]